MDLYAKGSCYRYKHYNHQAPSLSKPNLIYQVFKAAEKNKIWLADMTYIPTKERTLYLAVNLDIFTRKIVRWSMSARMQEHLVITCFLRAFGKEHPVPDLIVHTDKGAQYTSPRCQVTLRKSDFVSNISRKGNPYDNAMMESFYKIFKRKFMDDADFQMLDEAKQEIFKYTETYYNTKSIHSRIDYQTTREVERRNF